MIKPIFILAAVMIAAPAAAQTPAPTLPFCSAKVTDSCQQTAAQQARAMTGEQADKRDARNGGEWSPNKRGTATAPAKKAPKK
jgi:hypothetical protein